MEKLSIKEKIAKVTELKQLQQKVKNICDQEQKRNEEVTTQQTELERVTWLIQPIHQKLHLITQQMEEGLSKHISSDHVEQLENKAEEVNADVSQVQILQEFQNKVGLVAQPVPED